MIHSGHVIALRSVLQLYLHISVPAQPALWTLTAHNGALTC